MTDKASKEIRAAGGIISGVGMNRGKIAVVIRKRYGGEIGLPKGKLRARETEPKAAVREVEEETGVRAILQQPVGSTHYIVDGRPKTVTYFLMEAPDDAPTRPADSREVREVQWLTPEQAVAALTHEDDRTLITRVFNIDKKPT